MSSSPFSRIFKTTEQKKEQEEQEKNAREELKKIKKMYEKDVEKLKKLENEDRIKLVGKKFGGNTENIENLCTENGMKKTYLNKDFKSVIEYFRTFKPTKEKGFFQSTESNLESDSTSNSVEIEQEEKELEKLEELSKYSKTNEKVKIKLIISEISKSTPEKNLRKFLSPFASTLNLSPQFGIFHSALSIGPWILEWTNKSVCIPKRCYSNAAIIAVDVETTLETVDYEVIIDRLCEVICRWNTLYEYDKYTKNCQHFVDDLLANLDISPNLKFKSQMGDFLKQLRNEGSYETVLHLSPTLRDHIKVKEEKILFKSHKQLDQFIIDAELAYPKFSVDYKEELMLLKSYDRAFWLRNLGKESSNALYTPLRELGKNGNLELKCPFDDPRNTKTFGKEDWILQIDK